MISDNSRLAVDLRKVHVSHGYGRGIAQILRGINLSVPEGKIYGLLGPSGCGKTSLLRTIVGRLEPIAGTVTVFGSTPGSSDCCIPGAGVGYMPQELCLFPEFSIAETLAFYGRLARLTTDDIQERIRFLVKFLDLPDKKRLVRSLSGGQQRRVSLASALIHRPPLLILDEPTVGVDPLLRQSIWRYLVTLTKEEGLTVIVTTHYIEEARQADIVGLMRKGKMLAEAEPEALMKEHGYSTLEDVFLALCMAQKSIKRKSQTQRDYPVKEFNINYSSKISSSTTQLVTDVEHVDAHFRKKLPAVQSGRDSFARLKALVRKNLTLLFRNLPVLVFNFFVPSLQVVLFCLCIGGDPFDLPIAIVNHDSHTSLSSQFLNHLDNKTIIQYPVDDIDEAIESVKQAKTWGLIQIGENFTKSLQHRYIKGADSDNDTIEQSSVYVHLDMTNQHLGFVLQKAIFDAFLNFAKDMMIKLQKSPLSVEPPVIIGEAIYGSTEPSFTEFMAPGVIMSIVYIISIGLTTMSVLTQRKEGTMERTLIQGVKPWELIMGHLISEILIMIGQVALLLFFSLYAFQIPVHGSIFLVILLTILQGLTGMTFGLLISSVCSTEITAIMLVMAAFYPNLLLSGVIWPLQAMPHLIRVFSYGLPQTIPIETLRCIMYRGWGLDHQEVWLGFAVSIIWTLFFLLLATVSFNKQK